MGPTGTGTPGSSTHTPDKGQTREGPAWAHRDRCFRCGASAFVSLSGSWVAVGGQRCQVSKE